MENTSIQKLQLPELTYYSFNEYVEQVKKGVAVVSAQVPTSPETLHKCMDALGKAKTLRLHMEKKLEELTRPAKDTKKAIDEWQRDLKNRAEEIFAPLNAAAAALNKMVVDYDRKVREEAELKAKQDGRVAQVLELGVTLTQEEERDIRECSDAAFRSIVQAIRQKKDAEKQAELDRIKAEQAEKEDTHSTADTLITTRKIQLIELGFVDNGRGFEKGDIEVAPIVIVGYNAVQWNALIERVQMEEANKKAAIPMTVVPEKPKGLTTIWRYEIENEADVPREYCAPVASKIQEAVRAGVRTIPGVRIFEESKIR